MAADNDYERLIDEAISTLANLRERLKTDLAHLSVDGKMAVVRGMLLNLGGFEPD